MGVERAVTLWYLHRQILLNELASLESQLAQMRTISDSEGAPTETGKRISSFSTAYMDVAGQYKRTQERLCALGPCPRSMMG